jgi:hypothetical protein
MRMRKCEVLNRLNVSLGLKITKLNSEAWVPERIDINYSNIDTEFHIDCHYQQFFLLSASRKNYINVTIFYYIQQHGNIIEYSACLSLCLTDISSQLHMQYNSQWWGYCGKRLIRKRLKERNLNNYEYHNPEHYPLSYLLFRTWRFGDWILSPSSGRTSSVEQKDRATLYPRTRSPKRHVPKKIGRWIISSIVIAILITIVTNL